MEKNNFSILKIPRIKMDILVRFQAIYLILISKKNFFFLNFGIFKNALVTDDVTGSGKMENARNNNVKYKKKCLSYINIFLIMLLLLSIFIIVNLEPNLDLYYNRFKLYYNYSYNFLKDIYNNTNMYDDSLYYDDYL